MVHTCSGEGGGGGQANNPHTTGRALIADSIAVLAVLDGIGGARNADAVGSLSRPLAAARHTTWLWCMRGVRGGVQSAAANTHAAVLTCMHGIRVIGEIGIALCSLSVRVA